MCDGSDGSTSEGSAPRPGCSAESCGARNEDDVENKDGAGCGWSGEREIQKMVDGKVGTSDKG